MLAFSFNSNCFYSQKRLFNDFFGIIRHTFNLTLITIKFAVDKSTMETPNQQLAFLYHIKSKNVLTLDHKIKKCLHCFNKIRKI